MTLAKLDKFTKKVVDLLDRPNTQMTAIELKAWFDAAPEELRVFLNSRLTQIDTDFALKSEINGVTLGQILDGSLTDIKLSNDAGQIKERLSSFIATKGQPSGFASLGSDGKVPVSQLLLGSSLSIKVGTISHGGTIPKTAGYTNYVYFVSLNSVYSMSPSGYSGSSDSTGIDIQCSVNQTSRVVSIISRAESTSGWSAYAGGTANYIEIAW